MAKWDGEVKVFVVDPKFRLSHNHGNSRCRYEDSEGGPEISGLPRMCMFHDTNPMLPRKRELTGTRNFGSP